jgi:hypothetical protein
MLLQSEIAAHVSAAARGVLLDLTWNYVQKRSAYADAAGSVWMVSGSENHDTMRKSSYLLFEQVLEAAGRGKDLLADGHSVSDHRARWTEWWKEYFRQRAREGISSEIASPTYDIYGLECFANLRDLAGSDVLRRLAEEFETLFWADYAQDFLPSTGVRGGGMTRVYKDASLTLGARENLLPATYMYGWHDNAPQATNPAALIMAASSYRPPGVVSAMALHPRPQSYVSRHFGLGSQLSDAQGIAYLMTFPGGNASIRRDSWRTPSYVMGTFGVDASLSYTALNGQDRAMGVMFASGINHRIIVAGLGTDDGGRRGLWEIYGVSRKNCLVVARDVHASESSGTRIFISSGEPWDNRVQVGDWLFTQAGAAYAAIRIATGGYSATTVTDGTMLDLADMWAPIVIQTGLAQDYVDFSAFQKSVTANAWDFSNGRLTYHSEAGNDFTVWRQSTLTPQVDGAPSELNPTLTYDSAYMRGVHGEDTVTLSFPGMTPVTLNFAY